MECMVLLFFFSFSQLHWLIISILNDVHAWTNDNINRPYTFESRKMLTLVLVECTCKQFKNIKFFFAWQRLLQLTLLRYLNTDILHWNAFLVSCTLVSHVFAPFLHYKSSANNGKSREKLRCEWEILRCNEYNINYSTVFKHNRYRINTLKQVGFYCFSITSFLFAFNVVAAFIVTHLTKHFISIGIRTSGISMVLYSIHKMKFFPYSASNQ